MLQSYPMSMHEQAHEVLRELLGWLHASLPGQIAKDGGNLCFQQELLVSLSHFTKNLCQRKEFLSVVPIVYSCAP